MGGVGSAGAAPRASYSKSCEVRRVSGMPCESHRRSASASSRPRLQPLALHSMRTPSQTHTSSPKLGSPMSSSPKLGPMAKEGHALTRSIQGTRAVAVANGDKTGGNLSKEHKCMLTFFPSARAAEALGHLGPHRPICKTNALLVVKQATPPFLHPVAFRGNSVCLSPQPTPSLQAHSRQP